MTEAQSFDDPEGFYSKLLAENCDPAKGWVKNLEMQETEKLPITMKMHMRPIEGSSIKMIRSEFVFKGMDLSQYVAFLDDFENQQRDSPNIIKLEVFEKKDNSSILYV